jgi:predicted nucleic acid-binding protein
MPSSTRSSRTSVTHGSPTSAEPVGYVVLDTDVASLPQKRCLPEHVVAALAGNTLCVTFVTVGELSKWAHVRAWGPRSRDALDRWLGQVVVLPYDVEVARIWGTLAGAAQQRGRPRPVNDMWVAACCLHRDLPLATRNEKDFADFGEHEGLRLVATSG